jgi:hypothetical protein
MVAEDATGDAELVLSTCKWRCCGVIECKHAHHALCFAAADLLQCMATGAVLAVRRTCGLQSRSFSAQPMRLAAAPHGYQRLPHVAGVSFLQRHTAGRQAGRQPGIQVRTCCSCCEKQDTQEYRPLICIFPAATI